MDALEESLQKAVAKLQRAKDKGKSHKVDKYGAKVASLKAAIAEARKAQEKERGRKRRRSEVSTSSSASSSPSPSPKKAKKTKKDREGEPAKKKSKRAASCSSSSSSSEDDGERVARRREDERVVEYRAQAAASRARKSGGAGEDRETAVAAEAEEDAAAAKISRLHRKLTRAINRGDEERAEHIRGKLRRRGVDFTATEEAAAAGNEEGLEAELAAATDGGLRQPGKAAATSLRINIKSSSESMALVPAGAASASSDAMTPASGLYTDADAHAASLKGYSLDRDGNPVCPEAAIPSGNVTLLLFYAYVVPPWTPKQRATAIEMTHKVLSENKCTGRLRVALEGFNSTLTGPPEGIRAFTKFLREWQPEHFGNTDFKLVEGLADNKAFKFLKVWPVVELVNYGFSGAQAPLSMGGTHVKPDEWVELAKDPDTVLIDVRNANETAIGAFFPPPGGATPIDPRMRRSTEFAGWVKDNLEMLKSKKKVMMVCTAGVRCERASALVAQMGVDRSKIVQLEGGIHRYLDFYPKDGGGLWKGVNYVFDQRFQHGPIIPQGVVGKCACCHGPWERYQAKAKCSVCRMETLLCRTCERSGKSKGTRLLCWLCEEAKAKGGAAALKDAQRAAAFAKAGGRDGEGEGAAVVDDESTGGGGGGAMRGGRGGFRGGRGGSGGGRSW